MSNVIVNKPTLTVGDLIEKLSNIDPETPVIAYSEAVQDYINIVGVTHQPGEDIAVTIETHANFDTRQW